jgi:ribose/xylose/arabinose/galactoside ABC-type transport system permease subunit
MKIFNWDMWFGVWSGILIISLVNVGLTIVNHNQFLFNEYILGVSIIVVMVITIMRSRSKIS